MEAYIYTWTFRDIPWHKKKQMKECDSGYIDFVWYCISIFLGLGSPILLNLANYNQGEIGK